MMNIAMPSDLDAASAFRYPAVFQNNIQVAETSTICRNTTLAAYISLYIYILRFAWNFKSYRVPGIRSLLGPPPNSHCWHSTTAWIKVRKKQVAGFSAGILDG